MHQLDLCSTRSLLPCSHCFCHGCCSGCEDDGRLSADVGAHSDRPPRGSLWTTTALPKEKESIDFVYVISSSAEGLSRLIGFVLGVHMLPFYMEESEQEYIIFVFKQF